MAKGRNRNEQKYARIDKYNTMVEKGPPAKAAQDFHRQAYPTGAPGVRKEPRHIDAAEYLKRKGVAGLWRS